MTHPRDDTQKRGSRVAVIIPALNEEASIGTVVREFREALQKLGHEATILVGDNDSTDRTRERAIAEGAQVEFASTRGYGAACLAAMSALSAEIEIVIFADGDGADDPKDLAELLAPLLLAPLSAGSADMVIGSRVLGERKGWVERGALTLPQRFGNRLSAHLLRRIYGARATDLGPFRSIKKAGLDQLAMDDLNFGWTVQMQARAAKIGLRTTEIPVHYRRRKEGESKVSGDLKGAALAGGIILRTLYRERFWRG